MRRTLVLAAAAVLAVIAVAAPAGAADPPPERRREHLRLQCERVTDGDREAVGCRWSPSKHPRFAAYRLVRADREDGRTVVFRTGDRDHTRFLDTTADRSTPYGYRVLVFDRAGHVIGGSRVVPVRAPAAA